MRASNGPYYPKIFPPTTTYELSAAVPYDFLLVMTNSWSVQLEQIHPLSVLIAWSSTLQLQPALALCEPQLNHILLLLIEERVAGHTTTTCWHPTPEFLKTRVTIATVGTAAVGTAAVGKGLLAKALYVAKEREFGLFRVSRGPRDNVCPLMPFNLCRTTKHCICLASPIYRQ